MLGAMAGDDPTGQQVYESLAREVQGRDDVILINNKNNILTNAVQREAAVVLQKSLREGFALTVSEALWKRTPVVASNVGGIPLQIDNGENGYIVNPKYYREVADRVIKLLNDKELREEMGKKGREKVKENFLMTRHVMDWLKIFKKELKE